MKLPQVRYRPVESLGRNDLSSVGREISAVQQQGNAYQGLMDTLAGVTADYIERKENAEYNEQIASFNIELSDWQSRHSAKQFYSPDEIGEIPEEIVARTVTSTNDQGVQITENRDSIPAYEVYPHLLAQKLAGMAKDKAEKITNPRMRETFLQKAEVEAANMVARASVNAEQAQQKFNFDSGVTKATNAAMRGDLATAKFIVANLETDSLTKEKVDKQMEALVESYEVTQAIRSTDVETIMAMRSMLDDENYDGSLTEPQRQAAIGDLTNRLNQVDSERVAAMAKQHDAFISDAYVGIENGTFTLQDVERYYQGWLKNDLNPITVSAQERTALRNAINRRNAQLKGKTDMVAMGAHLIANGGDPKDSDHQKAIDAYVQMNQISDLRELENIAFRSNIMPQVVENYLNIAALHDAEKGGDQIPQAVQLYGRLSDSKPALLAELGKESKNVLADTHLMVRGGMPVMDAYAMARENARIKPEFRETRERAYREEKYLDDNPKALANLMDDDDTLFGFETTWYGTSPLDPNLEMQSQFDAMTEMHYLRTGDISLARKRAWTDMQERWSPTGMAGTLTSEGINRDAKPMEYAPERLMMVDSKIATQRLKAFAEDQELNHENLIVESDDRTARDGSWRIWVFDPETDEVRFHPQRWVGIDWAEQAEEDDYNDRLEQAIKDRDQRKLDEQRAQQFRDPSFAAGSYGAQINQLVGEGGN